MDTKLFDSYKRAIPSSGMDVLDSHPGFAGVESPSMNMEDRIWVPPGWRENPGRILVLGQSGYGDDGPLNGSAKWIPAYVAGKVPDHTYDMVTAALKMSRAEFFGKVAFVNFVYKSGIEARDDAPIAWFRQARAPLAELLKTLRPAAGWIWGTGKNAPHSGPVFKSLGIPFEVASHPSRGSHEARRASWNRLLALLPGAE